ncbi:hypothetical protein CMV_022298 [Castanea mollissima]|uniref:Uncharacterized protein n=1 Tax=Castanea mollissima TaxID=60419 RepID=A0A8J4QI84_9ROSI|nr:hypothetical protein CMV_022298 [Castanea mollissima]
MGLSYTGCYNVKVEADEDIEDENTEDSEDEDDENEMEDEEFSDDLTFLEALNISFNQLVGPIPQGKQFGTFSNYSYIHNKELCGFPLTTHYTSDEAPPPLATPKYKRHKFNYFDLQFILTGLGFGVGATVIIAPLTFWEIGRKWHDNCIDKIILVIFPMLGLSYTGCYNAEAKKDEDIRDENTKDCENHGDEDEMEGEEFCSQYFVFCSKLDISRKRFILTGLGFGVGATVIIAPLTFWEIGRKWHDNCIDKIILVIFPMLGLSYTGCYNAEAKKDEDIRDENTKDCENHGDEDEMEDSFRDFEPEKRQGTNGNRGLCGSPLVTNCTNGTAPPPSATQKSEGTNSTTLIGFDWQFILTGLGFGVGAAAVVAPLTFWEKGRKWHDDSIDKILLIILPMMGLSYAGCYNAKVEAEEDIEDENTEDSEDKDDDDEMEDEEFHGRYCVICSKLDISRKRFILTGLGFGVGAAVVVAPLTFWEKGRKWQDDSIEKILLIILPMMVLSYTGCYNAKVEAEEDIEDENTEDSDDEDDDDEMEDEEFRGRYCVICSKLDISRKRVIHDPQCTCHKSPPISSS